MCSCAGSINGFHVWNTAGLTAGSIWFIHTVHIGPGVNVREGARMKVGGEGEGWGRGLG